MEFRGIGRLKYLGAAKFKGVKVVKLERECGSWCSGYACRKLCGTCQGKVNLQKIRCGLCLHSFRLSTFRIPMFSLLLICICVKDSLRGAIASKGNPECIRTTQKLV